MFERAGACAVSENLALMPRLSRSRSCECLKERGRQEWIFLHDPIEEDF